MESQRIGPDWTMTATQRTRFLVKHRASWSRWVNWPTLLRWSLLACRTPCLPWWWWDHSPVFLFHLWDRRLRGRGSVPSVPVASNSALPKRETEWSYISEPGKQWQLCVLQVEDFQRKYDWKEDMGKGFLPHTRVLSSWIYYEAYENDGLHSLFRLCHRAIQHPYFKV